MALNLPTNPSSRSEACQASYQLLVDSVEEYAIYMLDTDGRVVTWNQGAARIKGYSSKEIIGQHFSCFYPPEDIQSRKPARALRIAAQDGTFADEGWRIRKDGSRFWASIVLTALFDSEGRLVGFTKVTRDMTERKRHEDALHAAKTGLESQVQERVAQWRAIFDHGPVGMVKVGLDGRYLEVNPKFCEQLGYSAEELRRLGYQDLGPAEDIAEAEHYLQQLIAGEIYSYTREKVFIRKDGSPIWVEVSLSLVRDSDGHPMYLIGVGTDITERKRAEAVRAESEAAFRSIFEHAPVGIVHTDLNGRILRANRKYAAIFGYAREELAGMEIQSIVHPEEFGQLLALRGRLLAGELQDYVLEKRIVRKDGTIAWVNLNVSLGHDPVSGQPTHTIAILEDITTQKRAEWALDESRQRLALATQASGLGVWKLDMARQVFAFSANKAAMLGYEPDERQMSVEAFIDHVHPADRDMILKMIRKALPDGGMQQAEYRVIWPNGEEHWIDVRGQSLQREGESAALFTGVSLDITNRKRAEQQLRQFSVHLQRAREEERRRLAREIHDELGGALTAIKFDLALPSRQDDLDSRGKALRHQTAIAQIDAAIASLRRIISDLRPSVLDDIGLWAALEWQAQDFQNCTGIPCTYQLKGPEIELEPEIATELFRMVQEALTNIRRHAQASRASIRIQVTEEEITLRVQDNGVGIASDRVKGGDTYGLLGMQERARQLNGAVRISGQRGKGTLVRIWLPLDQDGMACQSEVPAIWHDLKRQ